MKINREVTIELTASDIEKAVIHYLKDKELVSDTAKIDVEFDISKYVEGETMMYPGHEVIKLRGCTVKVN